MLNPAERRTDHRSAAVATAQRCTAGDQEACNSNTHAATSYLESGANRIAAVMQAYYIFSIGNIKPLLKAEYPDCYKDFKTCGKTLTQVYDCPAHSSVVPICCYDLHDASYAMS